MKARARAGLAATAGFTMLAVTGCSPGAASAAQPMTVRLTMHFSKFEPGSVTVPSGRPIRFILHNADFIDHEFIVGDQDTQRRHETGRETRHGARPTEVDVSAGGDIETVVTFARGGDLTFACHVPGHFAYGMHGPLTVI